ncbi:MAG: right-handed parallel beta-helix repeat-containing protein, partial [Planctomycetia bacterium]|nr:right-handed parallel beta-helix repeat-containing protein [Planctomycetia bacterium]
YHKGKGRFLDCVVIRNASSGVWVGPWGEPVVESCQIRNGKSEGIEIDEDGRGTFLNNRIENHFRGKEKRDWFVDRYAGEVNASGNVPQMPRSSHEND